MGKNNEEKSSKDNGKESVKNGRNPDGTFATGNSISPGRPKGSISLVHILKKKLEEVPDDMDEKTWAELIVERALNSAIDGDNQMLKLAFQYVDGMPEQKTDLTSKGESVNLASIVIVDPDDRAD